MGRALVLQNDRAEARTALSRAARLEPWNPTPLLLMAELEKASPQRRAQTLLRAGEREAKRWNLRRAQRLLQNAAELDPATGAASWRVRARMQESVGRPTQALEAWREAIAAGAEDAEAWTGVGRAQLALGAPEAGASLRKALSLDPRHSDALSVLGRMHVEYGRTEQALPLLRRALEATPGDGEARRSLARALRATGRPAEALDALAGASAPEIRSAETWRETAAIQRELGDLDAARGSLQRAIVLEPYEASLQRDLALLHEASGDAESAEQAQRLAALLEGDAADQDLAAIEERARSAAGPNLDDLVLGFSSQLSSARRRRVAQLGLREPPAWRTRLLQWLHPRRPNVEQIENALQQALSLRFALVEPEPPDSATHRERVDQLYAFERRTSLDAQVIADVNALLDTDAIFVSRLLRNPPTPEDPEGLTPECADPTRFEIEMRMLSGQHPDVVSILMDVECLAGGTDAHLTWNRRALALYGCLLVLLGFPLLRGWGTLLVEIKLPPRTKGFLRIKIGTKPEEAGDENSAKLKKDGGGRLRRSLRSLSRYRKHMAGRETIFRWIPARKRAYYVTVRGPLFDALGDQVIGHFLEEQRVQIVRGKPARLTYDFNPDECAVQVTVLWDGEPARSARVALRDTADSLRYARDGTVFYYLGKGNHTVLAGAVDRATERTIEIRSVESAIPVDIDLGQESGLLIRGCPEAVEPYLLGDFETAASALEVAGEEQLAHLMRGAHHQQRGDLERASAEFEAAGCIEEAAELRASGADHEGSAALFEQAGDYARAAEAHRAAEDLADAARCYEAAYDYDSAIECYEAVGEVERVIAIHEKTGAYFDAASLAREHANLDRALQNLQAIERRDPSYGEACRIMADILEERGDVELAAQKIAQAIEVAGGEKAPIDLHERHAGLLERGANREEALEVYESIRRRDPRRSDVTQHIAALREEIAKTPGDAATLVRPASAESRYEILDELGRGGMGVVFKARDKRLNRIVALKRLPDNLRDNETAAQLFLREAQAAAALNHRNIVTVYDAGEENGVYHITMELLEGLPLNAIQEKRGVIGVLDVTRLGVQVCAGLQYAHEQRIVHRDIKTANLFFTREKVVKIMDFGLAKTIEEVRKNSTVIGGTPYYMAPEQAAGEAVDNRTDLYAFGVTLYRLTTGAFPFREGDLAYQHRHTAPPDPRELVASIPEEMAALILELLAKDPDARPRSAGEVGTRLQAIHNAPQ
jgi:tetratricopeptide (TPR) repeat protein